MAWRTAGGVLAWHRDLKAAYPAAAPPATPIVSWGTIGDLDHASTSDHAPHDFPEWGEDIVTAGDAPHVPALGLDMHIVTEAMRRARDPRLKYLIFWRRIFSSYGTSTRAAWSWGPYSNAVNDPHTDHAHLSVVGAPVADGTQPWEVGDVSLTPDQQQQLTNIHDWVFDTARGLITADPGTPHVTTYKPNEWLKTLVDRPASGGPTDEQIEAMANRVAELLRPELQGAAEAAVRTVLGALDGATPDGGA